MQTATAYPVVLKSATFNGIYLRNNLNGNNTIPSPGPYNLCPDIIQSSLLLKNPTAILGNSESWSEMYNVAPDIGSSNYYYIRGINSTNEPLGSQVKLYYAPAQLILLPSTWQQNALSSTSKDQYVTVQAGAEQKNIGENAFVWSNPAEPDGSDFYSFVAQSTGDGTENPIPDVNSWLDMSDLVLNNLAFAFRNTCQVDSNSVSWERQFMLTIPSGITNPGTLQISISTTGMEGNTISLTENSGDSDNSINIQPYVVNDNDQTVVNFQPAAGFTTTLSLQFENTAASQPAAGAGITVSISYQVPPGEAYEAGIRGTLNHKYSRKISRQLGLPIQQYATLGSVLFITD